MTQGLNSSHILPSSKTSHAQPRTFHLCNYRTIGDWGNDVRGTIAASLEMIEIKIKQFGKIKFKKLSVLHVLFCLCLCIMLMSKKIVFKKNK
jgi:hypothetical protein